MRPGIASVTALIFTGFILPVGSCSAQAISSSKLSSELIQLAESENPEEFARQHGLPIIDGSIKVTIVTTNGFPNITERYELKAVKRHKNLIEAVVSIEDLLRLSREKEIEYVRRPYKFWKWRK